MGRSAGPLTLGTAGHVDHGKTTLVAALTGVDTDRLPEEKARGLTIALGYAPLRLPSGRAVSLVDVPGHERFVRTMVAGATGVDAFLMVVAADDGVMPQTIEHAEVLRALDVGAGVVAVTKADVADPAPAVEEARELLPRCEIVAVSARTGAGLDELRAALDRAVAPLTSRGEATGPARLHVDRAFTVVGRGTVVTGTLWSGAVAVGDELEIAPRGAAARVRGVEVHDRPVERARAGQRVALNLAGVRVSEVARGDVLAPPGALRPTTILDCALALRDARHNERVQAHHGTRDAPARLAQLSDDGLWQLRLERPLLACDRDRLVVRRLSPPDTLGGGIVLDAAAGRHGRRPEILTRLRALRDGRPEPKPAARPEPRTPVVSPPQRGTNDRSSTGRPRSEPSESLGAPLDPAAQALAERLRAAGAQLLSEAQMADERAALRALREAGVAVRVSGRLYGHADVVADMRNRIVALLERDGETTLASVRDALGISRKGAQAFLEHLDATRVTRRLPDDRRILFQPRTRT
ncbi:selenocysteine-specific translation elongation factor [Conexibacter arvalis]|uniref:Selenocysteine-specific elongation factor n=1 Tax=Conexibacter arvalis TaxID=912552 RepID=A0A840IH66_9ACTN|nr:selenocysteine-specific translation elongation factor [Conexibacter arvalis]MBB4664262.1 selenocysteine-specific elongation factor [Conexibacter arvalis]